MTYQQQRGYHAHCGCTAQPNKKEREERQIEKKEEKKKKNGAAKGKCSAVIGSIASAACA
jgi:hypothetical protein